MSVYRHLCTLVLICTLARSLVAQTTPAKTVQTGYAILTPTDGLSGGLLLTGNLLLTMGIQQSQGVFTATPLMNAGALPIIANPASSENTGIAIVNPNSQAVNIMLVLRPAGAAAVPLNRNLTLGAGQQTAQFINQILGNETVAPIIPAVLTIVASLPVGVVGFNFEGANFGAVPVIDLTTVLTPSALAQLNGDIANGNRNSETTGTTNGVDGIPSTATADSTGVENTLPEGTNSLQSSTIGGMTVLTAATNSAGRFFPNMANGVGGNGALILPQFASNGGWTTAVVISNAAAVQRTFRVDFFDANGIPMSIQFLNVSAASLTNITLAPFGVVRLTPLNVLAIASGNGNLGDVNPTNGVNGTPPGTTGIGSGTTDSTITAPTNGVNGIIGF